MWSILTELFYHGCLVEVFFPSPSFGGYGILYINPIYEFSASTLFTIGMLIVSNMIVSTFQCFLYRHQLLLHDGHWLKFSTWKWSLIIGFHYITIVPSVLICLNSFPIDRATNLNASMKLLEEYPEYAFVANDPNIWIADTSLPIFPPIINFSGVVGLCIISSFFAPEIGIVVTAAIFHSFYLLNGNGLVMSAKTRSLHKKLCISLVVQMGLPFTLLVFPLLLYVFLLSTDTMISQEWLNGSMGLVLSHATISSVLICVFTEPYRLFLGKTVKRVVRSIKCRSIRVSQQESARRTVTQTTGIIWLH
ncbi:unnamed protein product, partial [Mesorhabditis belari]|uniref:Serpentine Receptor, class H n=1 Tax=Mesorhabditis belari TaxID=2138241 RepID=A0AAF3J510_9BILA